MKRIDAGTDIGTYLGCTTDEQRAVLCNRLERLLHPEWFGDKKWWEYELDEWPDDYPEGRD